MSPEALPTADEKARYEAIKQELKSALAKRRELDKHLAQIEVKIHDLETSYLNETTAQSGGNIIHGFEGYLKNTASSRKKNEIKDETDRIFSNSSTTYKKSLELLAEGEESAPGEEHSRTSTPALTTVIVPPARSQELSAAQNKKNRDREYQRKRRATARRNSSAALSDDESVTSASSRRPNKRARIDDD